MFYLRKEGEALRNGFNFYPLSDTGSFGFVFKLSAKVFRFRYSKIHSRWFVGLRK